MYLNKLLNNSDIILYKSLSNSSDVCDLAIE